MLLVIANAELSIKWSSIYEKIMNEYPKLIIEYRTTFPTYILNGSIPFIAIIEDDKIVAKFCGDPFNENDYTKFILSTLINQASRKNAIKITYDDNYLDVFKEERSYGDGLLE